MTFWKEKAFFSVNLNEIPVTVSVQCIYQSIHPSLSMYLSISPVYLSLCNKIEKNSWRIIWNSNQIIFVLFFNNIRFPACYLHEYSWDQEWNQEWNQTLNDSHIYGRGLQLIFLNRCKKKIFIIFIRYITYCSLVFLFHKQMEEYEKNKWKIELYSSWVLLCVQDLLL